MSIDVNVTNDLVIVTETTEDITVNVSNAAGPQGPAGQGVPVGGTTNQVLKKLSNTNYDTYWALDGGGVPYSGATGDVDLGEYELKAGQFELDTTPTGTASVAVTRWNDTNGVSETTLKGGNVVLKNGIDLVARVVNKVNPNTTLTKAAYQAVRVSGAQGQRLAVALAQANNDANSADTIGLVTETIATNQEGFIMTVGQLENINTTGSLQGETWADGDVLYLSPTTAGAITKVKPTGNGHIVVIGYVEYAHVNNGKIYVKVMNSWELDELHDVSIVSPANNEVLTYESSSQLWKNKPVTAGITGSGATGQVTYWNGTGSVTGSAGLVYDDSTGIMTLSKNQSADTALNISNSTINTSAQSKVILTTDSNAAFVMGKYSSAFTGYKIFQASDSTLWNGRIGFTAVAGDIAILNDWSSGKIKFAAGSASTAQMTLTAAGRLLLGTTDEGTYLLDVNGTARVSDSLLVQKNANSGTALLNVTNTNTGSSSVAGVQVNSHAVNGAIFATSSNYTTFGNITSDSLALYTSGTANMALTINGSGYFSIGTGSLPTEKLRVTSAGRLLLGTTSESTNILEVVGTSRFSSNVKIGNTAYADTASNLIVGINGTAARGAIANNNDYQDFLFVNTSISSGNINNWSFGQRRDTVFGNTVGSFQIIGAYVDNSGNFSTVGGGFRVPLICNPNGDVILAGASANAVNGNVLIGTPTRGASKLRIVGLPISSAGLSSGDIWNDGGTLKIV